MLQLVLFAVLAVATISYAGVKVNALAESFEGDTFPPEGWSGDWFKSNTFTVSGDYCAGTYYYSATAKMLETPVISIEAGSDMKFAWKNANFLSIPPSKKERGNEKIVGHDSTYFDISTDNGANWTNLHVLSSEIIEMEYSSVKVDLASYEGQDVKFRWKFVCDGGYEGTSVGLDNVYIGVDNEAPEAQEIYGNVSYDGLDMELDIAVMDLAGMEGDIVATYNLNGSDEDVTLTLSEKNGRFNLHGLIPGQPAGTTGSITIPLIDIKDNSGSATYDIEWKNMPVVIDESFEGDTYPAEGWDITRYNGYSYWNRVKSGSVLAYGTVAQDGEYFLEFGNTMARIESYPVDLSGYTSSEFSLYIYNDKEMISWMGNDTLQVQVLTLDDKSEWVNAGERIYKWNGNDAEDKQWVQYNVDLSDFVGAGKPLVKVGVLGEQAYYTHIDNFQLVGQGSGIEETIVEAAELYQNYPNPFNPSTSISFKNTTAGYVKLSVFNIKGELVRTLINGNMSAAAHKINFNASNLNSGVYYYTLETPAGSMTKKMILVK